MIFDPQNIWNVTQNMFWKKQVLGYYCLFLYYCSIYFVTNDAQTEKRI